MKYSNADKTNSYKTHRKIKSVLINISKKVLHRSFLVSNIERSPTSVSINHSKSIKNTLGHNSSASELCHRKKFIVLTKR